MDYIDDMHLALPHQQQVGESNIDFKRFQYYLDIGASRTYKKVSENFGITERRIQQISAKNGWKDRIFAINKMLNEQIISTVLAQVGETFSFTMGATDADGIDGAISTHLSLIHI